MAKWQELCELLMDKELTPQEIVEKLRVKPCRLKQMLESKRLAERLELVEKIAAVRADHAILVAMEAAADKLAALATNDTETGRKACLDVLAQGQALRTQRTSARAGINLANWHNDFRNWERKEKRKAERQAAEAKESPPDEWQEAARPAEAAALNGQPVAAGSAGDPTPDGAVPPEEAASPRRQRREAPPRRMSKSKRRELAGLPPEKKRPIPVVAPPPGYRVDGGFVPRPGGRVVQHLVCGKVFLGST